MAVSVATILEIAMNPKRMMVGAAGIEPATPTMSTYVPTAKFLKYQERASGILSFCSRSFRGFLWRICGEPSPVLVEVW